MKKNTIVLIVIIILSVIWGGFQSTLFPTETYGILYIVSAFFGGILIGLIGQKFRE